MYYIITVVVLVTADKVEHQCVGAFNTSVMSNESDARL